MANLSVVEIAGAGLVLGILILGTPAQTTAGDKPEKFSERVDSVPPQLAESDRQEARELIKADKFAAKMMAEPHVVTNVGPWHAVQSETLLGSATVITFSKPQNVNYCCWPTIEYDVATDSYLRFVAPYAVSGLTEVTLLVDGRTDAVVSIMPTVFAERKFTGDPKDLPAPAQEES